MSVRTYPYRPRRLLAGPRVRGSVLWGLDRRVGRWCLGAWVAALAGLVSCSSPPPPAADAIAPTVSPAPAVDDSPIQAQSAQPQAIDPAPQEAPTTQQASPTPPDRHADEMLRVLHDATQDAAHRRQAAAGLLAMKDTRANAALIEDLYPGGDQVTQQLIVQSLMALPKEPPQVFVEPLLGLVTRAGDPLLYDVAAALSRFEDRGHVKRLIKLALDRTTHVQHRRGAIIALGHYRDRAVAGVLVGLIQADEPSTVHDAAYAALAQITGIDQFDRGQWGDWWARHRHLSDRLWLEAIARSLADRNDRMVARLGHLEDRLVEVQRQLYRATPQADRSALLIALLDDSLASVRRLAIDLCVQRLTDTQPIGPELRAALRARLDDRSPVNRQRAALLLRDLADEAAAKAVARRLVSGHEQDREVLRAYLLVMAKMPQAAVMDLALRWLADPVLGGEAAGVLAAAVDAAMLNEQQGLEAARRVRMLLDNSRQPQPKFIELLGRVGGDEDWGRIAKWLRSDDDAVRQTAARAWADSSRPLKGLVRYAGDPVIQPIVIAAARRRGDQPETLMALLEHKPQQEQLVQAWRAAVVAVARRVSPIDAVLEADRRLAQLNEPPVWRDQVLSAAIDRLAPTPTAGGPVPGNTDGPHPTLVADESTRAVWIELLLTRAQVRLDDGDTAKAMVDYQRLEPMADTMDSSQRNQLYLGLLRAMLTGNDVDGAIQSADRMIATLGQPPNDPIKAQIVEMFLAAAQRNVATEQMDVAQRVLAWLRSWVGQSGASDVQDRIMELEQRAGMGDGQEQNITPVTDREKPDRSTQAGQPPMIPQTKPVPQK